MRVEGEYYRVFTGTTEGCIQFKKVTMGVVSASPNEGSMQLQASVLASGVQTANLQQ